jgi:ASC-1-like (ASCH) protein
MKEAFFIKQSKLVFLIVLGVLLLISNDYACQKKMKQIDFLQDSLKHERATAVVLAMKLTDARRYSQIETLLKEKGIELASPQQPAFEIHK